NDPLEQEADRVAEQVLAAPAHTSITSTPQNIQRFKGQSTSDEGTVPPSVDLVLSNAGKPLDAVIQQDMGQRFGHDFSQVRIHTDTAAEKSARDVDASAYTVGHNIVFNTGQFAPMTQEGRRLIAHELAHVVQQTGASARGELPSGILQRKPQSEAPLIQPNLDLVPLQGSIDTPSISIAADTPETAPAPQPNSRQPLRTNTSVPLVRSPFLQATPPDLYRGIPVSKVPDADDSSMPRLTDLLSQPQPQAAAIDPGASQIEAEGDGAAHHTTSEQTEVDTGMLLGMLAFGVGEARKIINGHSIAARSSIDWQAKKSNKKLEEQTKTADEAVHALANQRRAQIDQTILAHDTELRWLEKQCKTDARTYADNVKKAQTDGFGSYRLQLADAFDWWVRHFDKLEKTQSNRLIKETDKNNSAAWSIAKNYDIRYIKSYSAQSAERKQVQQDAVYEAASNFSSEIQKTKTEFLPELAKIPQQIKVELDKGRDAALVEFDKGLPIVLSGIDGQLASAIQDISIKAAESHTMLAKAAVQMRERVNSLEDISVKRNADFCIKIDGQIETGRTSTIREFRQAIPAALNSITAMADEAVGILTAGDDELDPDASERFVDEVVDFSLKAADGTGVVFATARDASIQTLAGAVPFAKRGLAAGKQDLATALHGEGVENEFALIRFNTEAEAYVRSALTTLDQTFNAAVIEADTQLLSMLNATRAKLREPMEETEEQIKNSVNDVIYQQIKAKWGLGKVMHNAARQAAWRYDHPYMKHVADAVEVILGFALVIAIVVGLIVMLPVIIGETAAAVILAAIAILGGFMIGYFGAKAYDERKKAGASGVSAFFGALADVTGINDVRRAFTDPKMSPFDRGVAWGQFWLSIFGAAAGAPRFLKAIKVRMPKRFTNPFRAKGSRTATTVDAQALHAIPDAPTITETPKIGYELPHQKLNEPEISNGPASTKLGRIGYELPHQKLSEPELPKEALAAPPPRKIGYELPREQQTPSPSGDIVSPRLHHRKPPVTPEAEGLPSTPKRKIGFKSSEEFIAPIDKPSGTDEQLHVANDAPPSDGVISQMPPAREVPSSHGPGGTIQTSVNRPAHAVDTSVPETPQTSVGEVQVANAPRKGSMVSNVEPEIPAAKQTQRPLSAQDEARLVDERAVQSAREQRIADEARVKKLSDGLDEIKKFKKELGPSKKRDYVDEAFDKTKGELKEAKTELQKSRRSEAEAEAAERISLLKRKDVDPAAALHEAVPA
ncbi:MAG: DUF4157 domain-containing protein, partial [Usitatibacteraceae bacterium]